MTDMQDSYSVFQDAIENPVRVSHQRDHADAGTLKHTRGALGRKRYLLNNFLNMRLKLGSDLVAETLAAVSGHLAQIADRPPGVFNVMHDGTF